MVVGWAWERFKGSLRGVGADTQDGINRKAVRGVLLFTCIVIYMVNPLVIHEMMSNCIEVNSNPHDQ